MKKHGQALAEELAKGAPHKGKVFEPLLLHKDGHEIPIEIKDAPSKNFLQARRSDFRDQISVRTMSYKSRFCSHSDTSYFLQLHLVSIKTFTQLIQIICSLSSLFKYCLSFNISCL
jgi:hypothetical protein